MYYILGHSSGGKQAPANKELVRMQPKSTAPTKSAIGGVPKSGPSKTTSMPSAASKTTGGKTSADSESVKQM